MLPRAQRGRAGWYFLQHLNFEVAFSIDELSEQYVETDPSKNITVCDNRHKLRVSKSACAKYVSNGAA